MLSLSEFIKENVATDPSCDAACGEAEEKPKEAVEKGDLPQKMKGKRAVIPDTHSQSDVQDQSRDQLHARDEGASDRCAKQQRHATLGGIQTIEKTKADGAADRHAPM